MMDVIGKIDGIAHIPVYLHLNISKLQTLILLYLVVLKHDCKGHRKFLPPFLHILLQLSHKLSL